MHNIVVVVQVNGVCVTCIYVNIVVAYRFSVFLFFSAVLLLDVEVSVFCCCRCCCEEKLTRYVSECTKPK